MRKSTGEQKKQIITKLGHRLWNPRLLGDFMIMDRNSISQEKRDRHLGPPKVDQLSNKD